MALPSPEERFFARIQTDQRGCIVWKGTRNNKGYGKFGVNGRTLYTHRWAWEYFYGEKIPAGLEIDHICRNTGCANPLHLDVVTPEENKRRAIRIVTHCPQGHEKIGDNIKVERDGIRCRECHRTRNRERYRRISKEAR